MRVLKSQQEERKLWGTGLMKKQKGSQKDFHQKDKIKKRKAENFWRLGTKQIHRRVKLAEVAESS